MSGLDLTDDTIDEVALSGQGVSLLWKGTLTSCVDANKTIWANIVAAGAAHPASGSDFRIKKNIEQYDLRYEQLFDSLQPCRYKYINGTSDRYHTGFIAQEVVDSLDNAGLTTQDFAAVMLEDPGEDGECWHLRRDEFVALNTWQIQKLKSRVSELEDKIAKLESLIEGGVTT
jgi:hypothetical protein